MKPKDIKLFWKKRRDNGTQLHNGIESFYKYGKLMHPSHHKYPEFLKFLQFHKQLKERGWVPNAISEMRMYIDPPWLAGTADFISYQKKMDGEYFFILIDWKACRTPHYVDWKWEKKLKYPLHKFRSSIHLKHSLQLYTYGYILEKFYNIPTFPFRIDKCRFYNVIFYHKRGQLIWEQIEAMPVKGLVEKMFEVFPYKDIKII